ncbi:hypothetical protein B0H14DRAFT_3145889 [Mycena olivaceomarginata]|nr:hypothetical protein B0H14DRAFT_3145889 [Mycena olivaceomarginata]
MVSVAEWMTSRGYHLFQEHDPTKPPDRLFHPDRVSLKDLRGYREQVIGPAYSKNPFFGIERTKEWVLSAPFATYMQAVIKASLFSVWNPSKDDLFSRATPDLQFKPFFNGPPSSPCPIRTHAPPPHVRGVKADGDVHDDPRCTCAAAGGRIRRGRALKMILSVCIVANHWSWNLLSFDAFPLVPHLGNNGLSVGRISASFHLPRSDSEWLTLVIGSMRFLVETQKGFCSNSSYSTPVHMINSGNSPSSTSSVVPVGRLLGGPSWFPFSPRITFFWRLLACYPRYLLDKSDISLTMNLPQRVLDLTSAPASNFVPASHGIGRIVTSPFTQPSVKLSFTRLDSQRHQTPENQMKNKSHQDTQMSAFVSGTGSDSEQLSRTDRSKDVVASKKSISPHTKINSDLRLIEKVGLGACWNMTREIILSKTNKQRPRKDSCAMKTNLKEVKTRIWAKNNLLRQRLNLKGQLSRRTEADGYTGPEEALVRVEEAPVWEDDLKGDQESCLHAVVRGQCHEELEDLQTSRSAGGASPRNFPSTTPPSVVTWPMAPEILLRTLRLWPSQAVASHRLPSAWRHWKAMTRLAPHWQRAVQNGPRWTVEGRQSVVQLAAALYMEFTEHSAPHRDRDSAPGKCRPQRRGEAYLKDWRDQAEQQMSRNFDAEEFTDRRALLERLARRNFQKCGHHFDSEEFTEHSAPHHDKNSAPGKCRPQRHREA